MSGFNFGGAGAGAGGQKPNPFGGGTGGGFAGFGQPAATPATGTPAVPAATSTFSFGAQPAAGATNAFGQPAAAAAAGSSNIFGAPSTANPPAVAASAAPTAPLFGGFANAGTNPAPSAFGVAAPTTATPAAAPSMSIFGNASKPPATPGAPVPATGGFAFGAGTGGGTNLFGGAGAKPAASGPGLFGAPQTASGTGGASSGAPAFGAGNMFGGGAASGATTPASSGGNMFGGAQTAAATTPAAPTAQTPSSALFGNPPPAGSTTPAAPTPATTAAPNLFGQPKPAGNLFGASPAAAATPPATGGPSSLFGGFGKPNPPPTAKTAFSTPSASGTTTPAAPANLFGGFGGATTTPAAKDSTTPAPTAPAPSAAAPATFGFGKPPAAASPAATPSGGFNFGGSGTSTSTTEKAPAAPTAAPTGNLFGTPAAPTAPSAPVKNLFSGLTSAAQTPAAESTTPTKPPPPAAPSFSFPTAGAPSGTTPTTPANKAPTLSFGSTTPAGAPPASLGIADKGTAAGAPKSKLSQVTTLEESSSSPAAATAPTTNLFGSFGSTPTAADKAAAPTSGAQTAAPSASIQKAAGGSLMASFGGNPTGTSPAGGIAAPPAPAPSMFQGRTLEEALLRVEEQLERDVKVFKDQAAEVRKWDLMLVANGDQIIRVFEQVKKAEDQKNQVDAALGAVEQRQSEILAQVERFEKEADDIVQNMSANSGYNASRPADQQRQDAAELAKRLHSQMQDLGDGLSSMINEMNRLTGSSSNSFEDKDDSGQDPVAQITAILQQHMTTLDWINAESGSLERQVGQLESQAKASQEAPVGRSQLTGRALGVSSSRYR